MSRAFLVSLASLLLLGLVLGCDDGPNRSDLIALQEEDRYVETIEPLRELLRENPDDPELNYRFGLALLADQQYGMAVWPLRRAADSPTWAVKAGLELAWAAHGNGTFDDAVNAATAVLAHEPENLSALLVRGQSHLQANREELALEDFALIEEIEPDTPDVWMSRGLALARLGRVEEASEQIAELRKRVAQEADSVSPMMCTLEAVFIYESGDVERSEQAHEACLRDHPNDGLVAQYAVDFYDETDRSARGSEILTALLAREPRATPLRHKVADRLRRAGELGEAERLLREGTTFDPGPGPWIALTYFFELLERPGDARDAMAEAMKRMPTVPPEIRFAYADVSIRAGSYETALAQIQHLPWPGYAEMIRGRIAFSRGDFGTAYLLLDKAVESQPANPALRQLAGQAAEQLGEFDNALSQYREAVRINQPGVEAGLDLARLLESFGRHRPALDAAMTHQKLNPDDDEGYRLGIGLTARLGLESATTAQLERIEALVGPGETTAIRASIAADAEDFDRAAEIVQETNLDLAAPTNRAAVRTLTRALLGAGRGAEAKQLIAELAPPGSTDAELLAISGEVLEEADPDGAAAAYARALEIDPDETTALRGSARLAAARGDTSEAQAFDDRALAVDPGDEEAAWHAIRIATATGDAQTQERRLRARLRANPRDGAAALALARLTLASSPDEAWRLGTRASRLRAGPEAAETVAEAQLALGRPNEAVSVLQRVLEVHPERSGTRYRLALAHLAAGQTESAVEALERSLSGAPFEEADEARRQLARIGQTPGT